MVGGRSTESGDCMYDSIGRRGGSVPGDVMYLMGEPALTSIYDDQASRGSGGARTVQAVATLCMNAGAQG